MKKLSGNETRETFLKFFESKGHRRVRSSSLVPHGDPTLLFTNAGMNQFKDVFLGLEKRDYNRATTAQKCVRAGGKHNDLENVGFTKRHHTFFEMLGNFSFGDYFKKEAIAFAWELITSPEWYGIPVEKLYFTVFGGAEVSAGQVLGSDRESIVYWTNVGAPRNKIFEITGLKDNFWAMGDTGPCGPCSEVFYDMGNWASEAGHADCAFPCDCGRYVEFWNLVFMQFDRVSFKIQKDPSQEFASADFEETGFRLVPLPKPSIDTGMGLERMASVLLNLTDPTKFSNYDTDLFQPLMQEAARLTGLDPMDGDEVAGIRIIADHSRASTFLIADGVIPSNEGRGYVLRKIISRAMVYMGSPREAHVQVLPAMTDEVVRLLGGAYPELEENIERIKSVLEKEGSRYFRTSELGLKKLDEEIQHLSEAAYQSSAASGSAMPILNIELPGELAFKLYDTFGLRRDLLEAAADSRLVKVDWAGFDRAMSEQRDRGRASWKGAHKESANPAYGKLAETFKTEPAFYHGTCAKDARIEAILTKNGPVSELKAGESGEVVLDRTAIYAESGGQVADTGAFYDSAEAQVLAEVTGAYYPVAGLVAHRVTAKETLRVGDRVTVLADAERRARIMRNHTGTHLVNAALRNILGNHVKQAGSLNAPERLRFDFSHFAPVDAEELRDIEQQVNDEIRLNTQMETGVMSLEEALNSGALAFFGDKYPESNVRVVTIPDPRAARGFYSKELCGGTHVHRIGDVGVLKIVSEESVAAGVRRIEAMTGIGALQHYQQQAQTLREIAAKMNVGEDGVLAAVEKLTQTARQLEKELEAQKRKGALNQLDELFAKAQTIKGVKVIVGEVSSVDREGLRQLVDSLRQKLGSGIVALGMPEDGKIALIAGVTKDLTAKVHAGKLIQALAKQVGGSGGGRPDLAEAGGKDTAALKSALESVPSLLEPLL
jgi:alanyl-tRNA synthetase